MCGGYTSTADWGARTVTCRECRKNIRASSLSRHLADLHEIYQQQVVAEELLNEQQGVVYRVGEGCAGPLCCPFPRCLGKLSSGWMMRRHFQDVHPLDYVVLPKEGRYPHCPRCGMQVNPRHPVHINSKECKTGTARRHQRDKAVRSALALQQQFTMNGDIWKRSWCSNTLAACFRRMMMTSRPCKASFARLVGCGRELARCCARRMRHR